MENLPVFIRDVLVVKMTTLHIKTVSVDHKYQPDRFMPDIFFFCLKSSEVNRNFRIVISI